MADDPLAQLRSHLETPVLFHMRSFVTDLISTLENLQNEVKAAVDTAYGDTVGAVVAKVEALAADVAALKDSVTQMLEGSSGAADAPAAKTGDSSGSGASKKSS